MNKLSRFALLTIIISIVLGSAVVFSEPGSEKDPLITLSYLNGEIDKLKSYINEKLANIEKNPVGDSTNKMEVVELEAGQSLIGKAGTEIILRGGKGRIIAGELGGLSDITQGIDLKMGVVVPANHLLIVPRDDGRGVYVVENAIFLVRGGYEIR
ncbi:MAG: hypothetical protein GX981_10035 [Tissierellia bacterium]|nr:hypothetical protein [Tissierellia bacterium]